MPRVSILRDDGRAERSRAMALRLDGKAWLRVSAEELAELSVIDGDEVDDGRRVELERALARVRARLFVVRSLAAKAQSVEEIERKLAARDVPADIAQEVIALATGYGYLDDASLAGQLARGTRSRGYGRRRAERTLSARGLPRELADAALQEAYGAADEVELARAALGRRSTEDDAARRRAAAFLARRGFSGAAAWAAVRAAVEDERQGGR